MKSGINGRQTELSVQSRETCSDFYRHYELSVYVKLVTADCQHYTLFTITILVRH